MDLTSMTLDIEQHIDVKREAVEVFEGMIREFTDGMRYPDGRSMNMMLERWPGGRWYRDLGDNTGHLWGIVQSIKPPVLLEIYGPMFMSYPVAGHMEVKCTPIDGGTRVTLRHRALGFLQEDHKAGVATGWGEILEAMRANLEK